MFSPVVSPIKCLLLGKSGVGKTTFIERHMASNSRSIIRTDDAIIYPVMFNTNRGSFQFHVWDVKSDDIYNAFSTIYRDAKCAILMYDITSKESGEELIIFYRNLVAENKKMNTIVCANKLDIRDPDMKDVWEWVHQSVKLLPTCEISAKTTYNYGMPFLSLCQQMLNDPKLEFVSMIANYPPDPPEMDEETKKMYDEIYRLALEVPLPYDSDFDLEE